MASQDRLTLDRLQRHLTNCPHEVCEMARAQGVFDKVEAAYRRSNLPEKRCQIMEDGAKFCATPWIANANAVPLRKATKSGQSN